MMEYRKNGPVSVRTVQKDVPDSDGRVPGSENAPEVDLSKRCALKHCLNTFDSSPSKIFFPLPRISTYIRSMWLKTIGMDPSYAGNDIYCCEDHFDMHKDVKSLVLLKEAAGGGIQPNLLKSTVFPHFNINPPPSSPPSSPNQDNASKSPAVAPLRVKSIQEVNSRANNGLPPPKRAGRPPKMRSSHETNMLPKEKICLVPSCGIKSSDTDSSVFHVCVPFSKEIRSKWLDVIGVKPTAKLFSDTIHVCTNHFEDDELETFATPNQHLGPLATSKKPTYMRAKHNVLPSLNLRPAESAEEPASDTRTVERVPKILSASTLCTSTDKFEATLMPTYPNCVHANGEGYRCTSVSVFQYSNFYSRFYGLSTKNEQIRFIMSRVECVADRSGQAEPVYRFSIDQNNRSNLSSTDRVRVCAQAFATALAFDVTTLIYVITEHFKKDFDDSAVSGLPQPDVVLKPVKCENEENGEDDLMVYEQIPRPIELDDDEMEKKPKHIVAKEEDPLAEDEAGDDEDNQDLLTLEEELHKRINSTKDDNIHLAFPSDEYSKLTSTQFPRDRHRHHVCPKCNQSYKHRRLLEDHILSCEGTNPITNDMYRLIEWTILLSEKIVEVGGIENARNCRVLLSRKEIFAPIDPLAEPPRVKRKPGPKSARRTAGRTTRSTKEPPKTAKESSKTDKEPTPAVADEEVDVEGTIDEAPKSRSLRSRRDEMSVSSSTDKPAKKGGRNPRKKPKESQEVAEEPEIVQAKKSRRRRNIRFTAPSSDEDAMEFDVDDPAPNDPDFDPMKEIPARKRKAALQQNYMDPDDSSEDESQPAKKSKGYRTSAPTMVPCGICGSVFATLQGLRYHHRISLRCGKQNQESNFQCDVCTKVFGSQTSLDEHRAKVIACKRDQSEILKAQEQFNSRSGTGPLTCKGCNVDFNSTIGFGLHLKRSLKCVPANPDVDIPGVVDRNAEVMHTAQGQSVQINKESNEDNAKEELVYLCEHCYSSFSSIWGLRTHERNSVGCKPDRPYEIPVPKPKSLADKLKKEFKEQAEKEREQSKDKNKEASLSAPPTTMVYTQQVPNKDGKFKCSCNAVFNSIWGFRSHQRMSEKCKTQTANSEDPIFRSTKKISITSTYGTAANNCQNVCSGCSARFSTPVGLRCHFRNSPNCGSANIFAKVDASFTSDATVTSSGQVRGSPGSYLCPCCPKDFKLPASLEQHFIEHAPNAESWDCGECNQVFADQFMLHRHFHKDHMGQWFCIMCYADENLESPNISTFKEFYTHIFGLHSNGHQSKSLAHKCMICFRSFATKGSLDLHTTTCKKSTEQKFSCASCGKIFSKKIHLNNHMRFSHPDIDVDPRFKFKCPNCPQRYMTEEELLVDHVKEGCLTAGDACDLCGEIYYIRGGLQAHMKAAHTQKVYPTRQGRPPKAAPDNSDRPADDCGEISSSLEIEVSPIVKIEAMSPESPES